MDRYLTTLISAAILSAVAKNVSPERWQKYIRLITGIMLVSVIVSPMFELAKIDLFEEFSYIDETNMLAQHEAVKEELEKRVSEDATNRLSKELGGQYRVQTDLLVNENNEIEGVKEMIVWTKEKEAPVTKILGAVYSPQKISFRK